MITHAPPEPPLNPIPSDSLPRKGQQEAQKQTSLLQQPYILFNDAGSFFCPQAHGIEADVIVIGIAPGKPGIILMIGDAAVIRMLHELLSLQSSQTFLMADIRNALLKIALQEHRNEILAVAEDIIAATADDDAILLSNHIR